MTPEYINMGPGRPRKTATIRKRTIRVYLPTMQMVDEWKSLAKEHHQSISKFVIERVEDVLRRDGEGPRHTRKELLDRTFDLESEMKILRADLHLKSRAYQALELELQMLRIQPYQNPIAQGMKKIHSDLVQMFIKKKRVKYDELLPELGIKPTDIELVQGINNQIEILTTFGLLEPDLAGWRWLG